MARNSTEADDPFKAMADWSLCRDTFSWHWGLFNLTRATHCFEMHGHVTFFCFWERAAECSRWAKIFQPWKTELWPVRIWLLVNSRLCVRNQCYNQEDGCPRQWCNQSHHVGRNEDHDYRTG
jgi:hypothetical protein